MRNGMSYSEAGKIGYLKVKSKFVQYLQNKSMLSQENYCKNKKKCKQCEKTIEYEKRRNDFCSSACSAIYNNTRREKREVKRKKNKCLYCNNDTYNHKFCNAICHGRYKQKTSIEEIEHNGAYINSNCDAAARRLLKIYLTGKNGHKCEICKNSEWMGKPIPLVLDHIDGNYLNNKLTNVRLVCANCDRQLPTSNGKNKGNGRKSRRLAYLNDRLEEQKIIQKTDFLK